MNEIAFGCTSLFYHIRSWLSGFELRNSCQFSEPVIGQLQPTAEEHVNLKNQAWEHRLGL